MSTTPSDMLRTRWKEREVRNAAAPQRGSGETVVLEKLEEPQTMVITPDMFNVRQETLKPIQITRTQTRLQARTQNQQMMSAQQRQFASVARMQRSISEPTNLAKTRKTMAILALPTIGTATAPLSRQTYAQRNVVASAQMPRLATASMSGQMVGTTVASAVANADATDSAVSTDTAVTTAQAIARVQIPAQTRIQTPIQTTTPIRTTTQIQMPDIIPPRTPPFRFKDDTRGPGKKKRWQSAYTGVNVTNWAFPSWSMVAGRQKQSSRKKRQHFVDVYGENAGTYAKNIATKIVGKTGRGRKR